MSVLLPPQDHKELFSIISLVAFDPKRFDLLQEGELRLARNSCDQRITGVFKRLVEQYEQLTDAAGHKPVHTKRCLEGLHLLASRDITGQAKKALPSLPCRVARVARKGLPSAKELTASQC